MNEACGAILLHQRECDPLCDPDQMPQKHLATSTERIETDLFLSIRHQEIRPRPQAQNGTETVRRAALLYFFLIRRICEVLNTHLIVEHEVLVFESAIKAKN